MNPPSLAASAASWATSTIHLAKACASSGVAFASTMSSVSRSSCSTAAPAWLLSATLKPFIGFSRCWPIAMTCCDTTSSSSSCVGGAPTPRRVAIVSLESSIGPPGSASEIAMPAIIGARRTRTHSSSVNAASAVMSNSFRLGLMPRG